MKSIVFYFRGLNTTGDELLRFARLKLWPMHRDWQKALRESVDFVPVLNQGGGPLGEQIVRATEFIQAHPLWRQTKRPIFFLAHSAGGLVARGVVHKISPNSALQGITFIATPHQGSYLAETILKIPQQRPLIHRFLSTCGYKIEKKTLAFQELLPDKLKKFNEMYPFKEDLLYKNFVCTLPRKNWSWPLQTVASLALLPAEYEGDGIVELSSQKLSEKDTPVSLDHLSQIGANFYFSPRARRKHRQAWLSLVQMVKDSFQAKTPGV